MTRRGIRFRLTLFAVLSAIGIVYVGASYLGVVNEVLGRYKTVYVDLPDSGGSYVGSEADYRGVKVGKISGMMLTRGGVRLKVTLDDDARVPVSSQVQVSDLTAIGEQYLNFIPDNANPPYASNGHIFTGTAADLPVSTNSLLLTLNSFVNSVNTQALSTSVTELGTMFRGNADAIGTIIDQGSKFLQTAQQHIGTTTQLINAGQTVLNTQMAHENDLQTFSSGLATLTAALKSSDTNLRTIINTGAISEANSLVQSLQTTLPSFLNVLVPVTEVVNQRRVALEQTLVTFPPVVAGGFTGTPGDGYGHLNMQFDYSMQDCTGAGYLPTPWPNANDTSDLPLYPARCDNPKAQPSYHGSDGILQRGSNMVPPVGSTGAANRPGLDEVSGAGSSTTTSTPTSTSSSSLGDWQSVLESNAWVSMFVGPVSGS